MRISSFKLPENATNTGIGLSAQFRGCLMGLKDVVILTGGNGSGKSRFLKLIQNTFNNFKNNPNYIEKCFKVSKKNPDTKKDVENELTKEMAKKFNVINYSHFDAKLQDAENFSPYVIHQAKNKLKSCNYEETALNSLLYLKDLCEGYSESSNASNDYKELTDFINFANELELDFSWDKDKKELQIFGRKLEKANLSPGQLYALRIAVACCAHETGDNFIFLLDEPETHLHPSLLIKIINKLMEHFENAQFFIATHSLPLISYITVMREDTTVLYMEKGVVKDRLRSDSGPILNNLVGAEDEQFAVKQLFVSPEELACNKFCMECFLGPEVISGGQADDPSTFMAEASLDLLNSKETRVIVDFGAGQGRLLECMLEDNIKKGYQYNAYNVEPEDAEYCASLIETTGIDGKSYLNKNDLAELNGKVDRVFMVNVLHEISPISWEDEFATIYNLLKEDGKLVIIERELLTVGESPFTNGYMMLTGNETHSEAANILFGADNIRFDRHKEKPYIIRCIINKDGIKAVNEADFARMFTVLKETALLKVGELRKARKSITCHKDRYKHGLELAFWLNQLSSTIMCHKEYQERRSKTT